jgi:hypothetical protein
MSRLNSPRSAPGAIVPAVLGFALIAQTALAFYFAG